MERRALSIGLWALSAIACAAVTVTDHGESAPSDPATGYTGEANARFGWGDSAGEIVGQSFTLDAPITLGSIWVAYNDFEAGGATFTLTVDAENDGSTEITETGVVIDSSNFSGTESDDNTSPVYWMEWDLSSHNLTLPAGSHEFRIEATSVSSGGADAWPLAALYHNGNVYPDGAEQGVPNSGDFLFAVTGDPAGGGEITATPLTLGNPGFEEDGIGSGDFSTAGPLGWVKEVPAGCVVGVIGASRTQVRDTPDGIAWCHLQNDTSNTEAPAIGQKIGAVDDALFSDPSTPELWVHFLASRRLNETTAIHATAYLYAAPSGASDWSGGTLIDSAVFDTSLANLIDGDPGSIAQAALMISLDNATAQVSQPGGDYWLVLANTLPPAGSQLHIDRVSAQISDDEDPGPIIPPVPPISPGDHVAGDLILFNDNGGWCWYQDERIIVDRNSDDLVIASVANYLGYGGEPRDGDMDITTFSPATGKRTLVTLGTVPTLGKGDDHNVAALWQRPDGRYFAKHTGHNYGAGYNDTVDWGDDNVPRSFHRTTTLPGDGSAWDAEQVFTWPELKSSSEHVTYTNLHFMSAEGSGQGRLYNIARADDRSPNLAWSDDQGATWTYGGKLSTSTTGSSYSNGYFVFAGNGTDRIDFMCTEHHPRDYNNSIYHGYIQGGKSYDSFGNVIDADITDNNAPAPQDFTPVWTTSSVTSSSYHHGWTMEIELIDGVPYGLFTTRYGTAITDSQSGDADHRLFYARFDGAAWQLSELCKMGDGLHGGQQDYTGLGSIHPNDPSLIYISSEFDPRDDTALPKHEIFKGVTSDQGATWSWTPITENSTVENLRPIIPAWKDGHTAVLWLRGRYPHQRDYDESPVGIIERPDEESGPLTYIDADLSNTTLADGSALVPTGPGDSDGAPEGQWHLHTGLGNGATAFTTNDTGAEDSPALRTRVEGLEDGVYDVYALFWSRPGDDWRIRAGFATSELLVFRRFSCQQVEPSQFSGPVDTIDPEQALYRAYVGRRTVTDGEVIDVFLDDFDGAADAGSQRSAYDGLGISRVLPVIKVETGKSESITPDDGPYASIHNDGTLVVKGTSDLEVVGSILNRGFLDLLNYTGPLPADFINEGTILDRSNADLTTTITGDPDEFLVSVPGYAGHIYQLQRSGTLLPESWMNAGDPIEGTGTNGIPLPIHIRATGSSPFNTREFYRFVID